MERIHQKLNTKYHWYNRWHKVRGSEVVHWAAFVVVVVLLGFLIQQRSVVVEAGITTGSSSPTALPATASTTLAVIVFNTSTNTPFNLSQVQNYFFDNQFSVANYFGMASSGAVNMVAAGQGVYEKPFVNGSNTCSNITNWTTNGRSGINADYYIYMFPEIHGSAPCPPAASVGGWECGDANLSCSGHNQVWLDGADVSSNSGVDARSFAVHELLHAIGSLHHASVENDPSGNPYDIMAPSPHFDASGYMAVYYPNAYHRQQLGWLGSVTNVSQAGQYTIDSQKALAIHIDGTSENYYVEYRPAAPPYDNFPLADHVSTGVLISIAPVPATFIRDPDTLLVGGPWQVGQPFVRDKITIATCSIDHATATVGVSFDGSNTPCNTSPQPCKYNPPFISVTPVSGTGSPGDKMSYKVTITNNDAHCPASTFDFGATLPAGWKEKPASRSEQLVPGGSNIEKKFKVISSQSTTPGSYNVVYSVTGINHPTVLASPVQYVVGSVGATATPLDSDYSPFATLTLCGNENDFMTTAGTPCTLAWNLDYASSPGACRLDPGDIEGTSGSISVTISTSMTYRLTCTSGTSTSSTMITATVNGTPPPPPPQNLPPPTPPPPPVTISAQDSSGNWHNDSVTVAAGTTANVRWSSVGMASCLVGPNSWGGISGNRPTGAIYVTQTWTATCRDATGNTALPISVVINVSGAPPPACGGGYVHVLNGATYIGAGNSSTPGGVWQASVGTPVQLWPGTGYTSGQYDGSDAPASISGNSLTSTGPADVFMSGSGWVLYNGASGCNLGAVEIKFSLPDFSMSCSPSSQSVTPGNSTSYSIGVSSANGFNSPVIFNLKMKPITSTITSTGGSISSPYATFALPVFTTSATPTGTYSLIIQGVSGALTHSCAIAPQLIAATSTK